MRKIFYAGTVLFLLFFDAHAQQTFNKTVTGNYKEIANDMVIASDGSFVLAGETTITSSAKSDMFVTKLNINGDIVWGRILGTSNSETAKAITDTKDGGVVVAGSCSDAMSLTKLSTSGTLQWSKTYSASKFNGAHTVIQTFDGGLAIGGYAQTDLYGSSGYFVKTDASGNVEWSKRIFDYSFYPSIQSMVQAKDSGYICVLNARRKPDDSYSDVFIVKIDKKGGFIWSRSIGGDNLDFPSSVVATNDGGCAVLASSFSFDDVPNANLYLIKLDNNADLQWSKTVGDGEGSEYGWSLIQTPDGGLIAAGQTSFFGEGYHDVYLAKVDVNGNLIYTKTIGTERTDIAKAIAGRPDGSFAVCGYTDFYSLSKNYEMMLLKFDGSAGICSTTGSGGVIKNAAATLYAPTVKIFDAATTTGSGPLLISSAGLVTTICSETLPVKLISFTAAKNNAVNILLWTAVEEVNVSSYIIERSNDGIQFTRIGSVNAKENNASTNDYSFTDINPAKAINYYRLKIIDKDGHTEYSVVRNVNNSGKLSVRLYKNPVHQNIPLEFSTEKEEVVQISVTGIDGRLCAGMQTVVSSGTTIKNIPAAALPCGIYFIKIKSAFDEVNIRFVKQ